jgi:aryl-alcohol dehydrogenase-like predicted oxidoreductase
MSSVSAPTKCFLLPLRRCAISWLAGRLEAAQAGGTFIDTAGSYAFWIGTQGGESEELLGRWRRSRGVGGEIVIATKVGARPLAPAPASPTTPKDCRPG